MSIAIDHRPKTLDEIVGNSPAVKTVKGLLSRRDKFPHAILITGPTGCGKTTIGRIIAGELGARESDYKEYDTADFRGIDTVRDIRKQVRLRPQDPKSICRVWLLDECHGLTKDAQQALLKALEDAPSHVYFILCTTDPEKLLPTIKGRCAAVSVSQITDEEMEGLIVKVCRAERVRIPQEVRQVIVDQSLGHPRNALQILGKIIGMDPADMKEAAEEEAARQSAAIDLARALIGKKSWSVIVKILDGLEDADEESIRRLVLKYCWSIMKKGRDDRAALIFEQFEDDFFVSKKMGLYMACYRSNFIGE